MHYLEKSNSIRSLQEDGEQGRLDYEAFLRDFNDTTSEMFEYGVRMLHKRRADPQPDLMSAIAAAQLDGQC